MKAQQAGIVPVASGEAFDALRARWSTIPTKVKFSSAADCPDVDTPFGPIYILLRGEETGGQLGESAYTRDQVGSTTPPRTRLRLARRSQPVQRRQHPDVGQSILRATAMTRARVGRSRNHPILDNLVHVRLHTDNCERPGCPLIQETSLNLG